MVKKIAVKVLIAWAIIEMVQALLENLRVLY